jgi:hypothetical protein
MEQAVRYAQLAKNTTEYLSCLYDIAQVRSFVFFSILKFSFFLSLDTSFI